MFRVPDDRPAPDATTRTSLDWIETRPGLPYFVTEHGAAWTPIGQNDAISWPELNGLFRRRDLAGVERHLRWLRDSGVTVLRLMLEYAQERHRYFERPSGKYVPAMVQLWDDMIAMCEALGLRLLLTPVDTFWTWLHWKRHPWNRANGGPLAHPSKLLTCPETRAAIKARLGFAAARWGGSGAIFAWDLWNEIHPAQAGGSAACFPEFIADLSAHVRDVERRAHGRAHLQTVSLFGPELWWRPEMPLEAPIFRHPDLDFATIHIYREGTIDDPRDTVAPALDMGRIVAESIGKITDDRPFLDTEHGPIHAYKDKHRTLAAPFDDEMFRHMQWAHLAAGGAGGGMRWPNRKPHVLTAGMRDAQAALAPFLPLVDWTRFRRRPVPLDLPKGLAGLACTDGTQAVAWIVRTDAFDVRRMVAPGAPVTFVLDIPGLDGPATATLFDTRRGKVAATVAGPPFTITLEGGDIAIAVGPC
jgi:mannan endo-1,4-beta-mannosidase